MHPDENAELAFSSVRIGRSAVACAWLIALSSAPFVQISTRWLELPLDSNTVAYVYPYWGAALVGVALFVHDVWSPPRVRRAVGWRVVPLALFAVWLLASTTWGDSPYSTATEAMLLVALLPGACWFGAGLTLPEQLASLGLSMHLLVAASLAVVWTSPESSIDLGNWVGVFANRNSLAPVAALGALTAVGIWLLHRSPSLALPLGVVVVVDLYVLYRTGGDTSILALGVAVAVAPVVVLVRLLKRRGVDGRAIAIGAVATATAGWFLFFAFIGPITSGLGKDETLSNRRVVWQYLREVTAERRWKGFGYGSFWDDPALVYPLYERTSTIFDSAHSTLMEVYVSIGAVGAALLLVIAGSAIRNVAGRVWFGPLPGALVWASLLAFVVVENLTESLIAYHSFMWALVIASVFAGGAAVHEGHAHEEHGAAALETEP